MGVQVCKGGQTIMGRNCTITIYSQFWEGMQIVLGGKVSLCGQLWEGVTSVLPRVSSASAPLGGRQTSLERSWAMCIQLWKGNQTTLVATVQWVINLLALTYTLGHLKSYLQFLQAAFVCRGY